MRLLFVAIFVWPLFLAATESSVSVDTSDWEIPAWKIWKEKYASSSPAKAINKIAESPELQVPLHLIDEVLKGQTKLTLQQPRKISDRAISEVDLFSFARSRRLEVHDQVDLQYSFRVDPNQAYKEKDRFRDMKKNMLQLIRERKEDELLLLYVGETHALDLYFSYFLLPPFPPNHERLQWRNEVVYFGNPRSNETSFYTKPYYQFISYYDGVNYPEKKLGKNSLHTSLNFLSRLAYFRKLKPSRYKKTDLIKEVPVELGTLILMDIHQLRSVEAINDLPKVASLRAAGFNRVTFVMEGQKFGEDFSEAELVDTYQMGVDSISKDNIAFVKKRRQKAYQLLKIGFVYDPVVYAIHEKLKEYHNEGLEIRLTGVENVDRFQANKPTKSGAN